MSEFSELARITSILLEREMKAHRTNVEQLRQLDGSLAQLDEMRRAVQADTGSITARQILGADSLWQGWLLDKRADLLRRMAMSRAREAESLARARTAFSRAEAAKSLVEETRTEAKRKRLQHEADEMDALGRFRHVPED